MAFIFLSKYELLILIIPMLAFSFCPTVVVFENSDGKGIFNDKVKKLSHSSPVMFGTKQANFRHAEFISPEYISFPKLTPTTSIPCSSG